MSERPFMQLYVSDFIGDTLHLSTEQIGAYMLLLMAMWNAGGKLPADEAKLARVTRMSVKKWKAIADDLMAFFDAEGSEIRHHRLTKELQKSESKSQSRASAGAVGGAAKALKDKEAQLANAMRSSQHLPDTRNHIEEAKASIDHEFEKAFWPIYPRKAGKGQALKAYRTARKLADAEAIAEGVKRYSTERTGQDPAFTRHAATWLNGQCWLDEAVPNVGRPAQRAPPSPTPHQQRHQAAIDAFDRQLGIQPDDEFTGPTVDLAKRDFRAH